MYGLAVLSCAILAWGIWNANPLQVHRLAIWTLDVIPRAEKCSNDTLMATTSYVGCPRNISASCFQIRTCSRSRERCIALSSSCAIGEYYPVMKLTQGDLQVSMLGRQHEVYVFDFDFSMLVSAGFVPNRAANLTMTIYYQCSANMQSREPSFIGIDSDDYTTAIDINREIYVDNMFRLAGQYASCWDPLQPVAINASSTDIIGALPIKSDVTAQYTGQFRWIHLTGDSNMRRLLISMCRLCGDPVKGRVTGSHTCVCSATNTYIHYDHSWLGLVPYMNRTRMMLSDIVTPGSPGSEVSSRAFVTVVSLGSHTPHIAIDDLHHHVYKWTRAFHNGTGDKLVMALTTAVCIEYIPKKYKHAHGTWEILLRNNYRILALNELIINACKSLDAGVLDLFSWSLSAGCRHYEDAVHADDHVYTAFARGIGRHWKIL
jgi:hypothetical protein